MAVQSAQQARAELCDVACTQGKNPVARLGVLDQHGGDLIHGGDEANIPMSVGRDGIAQRLARNAVDFGLSRGIDFADEQDVTVIERGGEVVQAVPGPGIPMRLEDGDSPSIVEASGCRQRGSNLGGVVGIVVDDLDLSGSA